jgi:carbamoyl-phosphate synthase large subunit
VPKRADLKSILVIGSGPIVIGQACEFDYSGTQAIKALKEEGYRVILVNSNPATIMTDPELADATYIEPIIPEMVEKIIAKERPDALLPTMGGQTALNCALELDERGILKKYNVELIGAKTDAIKTAEDRELFRRAMDEIGLASAKSFLARNMADAELAAKELGFPLVLRPSRTLGGTGGGIVKDRSELATKVSIALRASPNHEVLIEECLLGWKEIELEVMRDLKDNVVIICGIENLDPMGVHTGDSITVAPIQTLTDKEYQILRDAALRVMRRIGVDTGGSNVQFAINPKDGRVVIIEMNPRVSRSSALASKATGFPIAKIAAKLAVGYSLDEIPNDITKKTPACFEPSIDYVVVKIPRFNFEKFPSADSTLGTQMKSVGEVMAFGRTFTEALHKAMNSMELDLPGFTGAKFVQGLGKAELLKEANRPSPRRLWVLGEALRSGISVKELAAVTGVDPWFLNHINSVIEAETALSSGAFTVKTDGLALKQMGFSDLRLAQLAGLTPLAVAKELRAANVVAGFKAVDTCAAEFVANTPYLYSTYESHSDAPVTGRRKIMILGSGPNRIGQGIEFDYCCVHAVQALRGAGFETIMVNCNPETVSTDYDTADRLYFEPLTLEHVMAIVEREKPEGVIVQYGGQTPLKLAASLQALGVPIIGTSVESIDIAEDRDRFSKLIDELKLKQPPGKTARTKEEALSAAKLLGYPLLIRPSFVLGGRSMRILFSDVELLEYLSESVSMSHDRPVLLDRYLENAVEVDVDVVADGEQTIVCGVMEHVERAGVHSGDSYCSLPPQSLTAEVIATIKDAAQLLARRLSVKGLMNVQFAVTPDDQVFILEVNPRASRTVPFVSKATGTPWAKVGALVMAGAKLKELGVTAPQTPKHISVKGVVFPFAKFSGVDTILGPEMKSTGEVMGIDSNFAAAFLKAQAAAGVQIPERGTVLLTVNDRDKGELVSVGKRFADAGFELLATVGSAAILAAAGIKSRAVNKVRDGSPHIVDLLGTGEIDLVVNTPEGLGSSLDSRSIRVVATELKVPLYTTMAAASAAGDASMLGGVNKLEVKSIQEHLAGMTVNGRLGGFRIDERRAKEVKGAVSQRDPKSSSAVVITQNDAA